MPTSQTGPIDIKATPASSEIPADGLVGSPLKKARASVDHTNFSDVKQDTTQSLTAALDAVVSGNTVPSETKLKVEEEEEL